MMPSHRITEVAWFHGGPLHNQRMPIPIKNTELRAFCVHGYWYHCDLDRLNLYYQVCLEDPNLQVQIYKQEGDEGWPWARKRRLMWLASDSLTMDYSSGRYVPKSFPHWPNLSKQK